MNGEMPAPLLCTFLSRRMERESLGGGRGPFRQRIELRRIDERSGETLAQGLIKAPLEKVWAVLADVARYRSSCPT